MGDTNWVSGLQGAGGGALGGAAVGGPAGAIVGGGLGLLGGLFGNPDNDRQKQMLQDYYNSVQNRQAPQQGPAAQSGYSDFRTNQSQLVNQLEALSRGQGPSLAAQQFQQATDRNMSSQQAMANSSRGGPMAQLTAANNMAGLGAQAAQGSAIARTGEELGALGQLGGVIQGARGADEQTNMFNADQKNVQARANLEAQLRTMGMNDQAIQATMAQMFGVNNAPTMGQQLLAGGAGMFALGAGQGGFGAKSGGGGSAASAVSGLGGFGNTVGSQMGVNNGGSGWGSGAGSDDWLKNGGF